MVRGCHKMTLINCWLNLIRQTKYFLNDECGNASQGSVILSLALFIILLAFFIVMNAVSHYSSEKVDGAFSSLDDAFSQNILRVKEQFQNSDENAEPEKDKGDSLENIQGTLRAILPGLDMVLTSDANGGNVMAIRMKKDMFDRLSSRIIPVFVRVLNIKDGAQLYDLVVTSYVRDPVAKSSGLSFRVLQTYRGDFIDKGIHKKRLILAVEQGNPAFLQFRFYKAS
jgi:hypothetical protein